MLRPIRKVQKRKKRFSVSWQNLLYTQSFVNLQYYWSSLTVCLFLITRFIALSLMGDMHYFLQGPRVSKLEKADILEMTVDHLNTVNRGALSTGELS